MATRQLDRGSQSQSTLFCLWRFSLSSLSSLSLCASQRETAKGAGALEILARIRRDGDEKDPSVQAEYQEIKENATITELLSGTLPWESKIRLLPASSRALEHTKDVLRWCSRPECLPLSLGNDSPLANLAYQMKRLQRGMASLTTQNPGKASQYGVASVSSVFSSIWLVPPFMCRMTISPHQCRAKGNAWGVVGWAIEFGAGILYTLPIFDAIQSNGCYVSGILLIPIIYVLNPETSRRTLESMNLLFQSDSVFAWNLKKTSGLAIEKDRCLCGIGERACGNV